MKTMTVPNCGLLCSAVTLLSGPELTYNGGFRPGFHSYRYIAKAVDPHPPAMSQEMFLAFGIPWW